MNRKTSIIISITGITIIALILISFTYGYYLTKIDGNESSKSISVTTGNMSVEYTDLSVGDVSAIIEPGYEIIKLFTIENIGKVQGTYSIYLTDVINEFIRTDDIQYTLYRKNGENSIDDLSDSEIIATGSFPKENTYIKTNEVIENPGDFYTYALKITYINASENQNEDQGHTFGGKVEIHAIPTSPYERGTLADAIFNNAVKPTPEELESGYATFTVPTPTNIATDINSETESVLSQTNDETGVSYYYRGAVKNNYLEFNNMCWRIVRIEGDGSIKITLAAPKTCSTITSDDTETALIGKGDYGYKGDYPYFADYENSVARTSSMKYKFNEWFTTNLASVSNKLKTATICIGDTTKAYTEAGILMTETEIQDAITNYNRYYYASYIKLYGKGQTANATLVCNTASSKTSETQIFPLTADEVVFAGGKAGTANSSYYLKDNASNNTWWTLTISYYVGDSDSAFYVDGTGNLNTDIDGVFYDLRSLRPTVSLLSGTKINSGDGSISNPYTIK